MRGRGEEREQPCTDAPASLPASLSSLSSRRRAACVMYGKGKEKEMERNFGESKKVLLFGKG